MKMPCKRRQTAKQQGGLGRPPLKALVFPDHSGLLELRVLFFEFASSIA
jgi:hypothetical protein